MKTNQRKTKFMLLCAITGVMLLNACTGGTVAAVNTSSGSAVQATAKQNDTATNEEPDGNELNDYATSKETEPDYEIVFPQDMVNEITIAISEENWATMMADMEEHYGALGSNDRNNPVGAQPNIQDGAPANRPGAAPGGQPVLPRDRQNIAPDARAGGPAFGGGDDSNPVWVSATIQFGDETWENVGIRFKGNSSLRSSWSSGNLKIPFKLDFDQFEEEYPATEDQRFYGFKQLSFSSNFSDSSYLREKVTADIFRDAGVPSAQTAFYAVYLDNGSGVEYMGLYTAVEVIDDTVIETQFSDDSGNVYKPEGSCATFAAGTFNQECYDKETNQDEADYSDVTSLLEVLHSNLRLTDSATWRNELESVFNVDEFINYLAVNTVVQNWDTYGVMSHNYYLYNDPESGLINWIPWDNNMALQSGPGGNGGFAAGGRNNNAANNQPPGGRGQSALSISLDEVGENWPLIRYILDDEVYAQQYAQAVDRVITDVFTEEKMSPIYDQYASLIEEYVRQETSGAGVSKLADAVAILKQHTIDRVSLAEKYLAGLDL